MSNLSTVAGTAGTAGDIVLPINNFYERVLLSAAKRTYPYYSGTMPGSLQENQGAMSVKWRRLENLRSNDSASPSPLGELTGNASYGQGRTAVQPTINDITVAISKYGNYFNLTEEVDLFNITPTMTDYVDNLGEDAGMGANQLMRDVMEGATQVRYADDATNTAAVVQKLQKSDLIKVVNTLQRNSAMKFTPDGFGSENIGSSPIQASFIGIVHPDVEEDVRQMVGFVDVSQYGGYTSTMVGEFGTVGRIRFLCTEIASVTANGGGAAATNSLRTTGGTSADIYKTVIYGREAVGSVGLNRSWSDDIYMGNEDVPSPVQIIPGNAVAGPHDPFKEVNSLAAKYWWAGRILNESWIHVIESGASEL